MCFSDCGVTQMAAGGRTRPPSGCSFPLLQHSECEGVNGAGWVENNAPCSWNPGKGWLYPRAQPSQASLKLLDLLSILLILKENKLHKWDRWFLFVMTVAPPPPPAPPPSQLSSRISPDVFFALNCWCCATGASQHGHQAPHQDHLIHLCTDLDDPFDPQLWHRARRPDTI